MAIVYIHKRNDTNQIFYVGKGKDIKRAFSKFGRNQYWKNITNKYGYTVEIIYDNLTNEKACEIEKQLINEFGRVDLATGILVNMTDGGEGLTNPNEEHRQKISNSNLGKKVSDFCKQVASKTHKNKIVSQQTRLKMSNARKGKSSWSKGKKMTDDFKKKLSISHLGNKLTKETITKRTEKINKPIIQLDLENNFVKEWKSIKEAKETTGISTIVHCLTGRIKKAGGYRWIYKPLDLE